MQEKLNHAALPSSAALAYLGDAVHSLYVREAVVRKNLSKSKDLHNAANGVINAAHQATLFRRIEHMLNEDERDVFRRAHNSKHLQKPKHMTAEDYRVATGFEALLGMLWWTENRDRLYEILDAAHTENENNTLQE